MRCQLHSPSGGLTSVGLPAGSIIQIIQGYRVDRSIPECDGSELGRMRFRMLDAPCLATWGTSVYRVRADGTLQLLDANHDSGD